MSFVVGQLPVLENSTNFVGHVTSAPILIDSQLRVQGFDPDSETLFSRLRLFAWSFIWSGIEECVHKQQYNSN